MRHIFKLLAASVAAATICSSVPRSQAIRRMPRRVMPKPSKSQKRASTPTSSRSTRSTSSFTDGWTLSDDLFLVSGEDWSNRDDRALPPVLLPRPGWNPTALERRTAHVRGPRRSKPPSGIDLTERSTPRRDRRSDRPGQDDARPRGTPSSRSASYTDRGGRSSDRRFGISTGAKTFGGAAPRRSSSASPRTARRPRASAGKTSVYLTTRPRRPWNPTARFRSKKIKFFAREQRSSPEFS